MRRFDYKKVFTLEEAYHEISDSNGSSLLLAGGTDLLVKIKNGGIAPQRLIDMKEIPQMKGISFLENSISIGALTTIRAVETSLELAERLPLLVQAAAMLGSVQVRNKATIGGNLCNAAPSAEMAPALLALDVQAEIYGKEGLRVVKLSDFFSGPGSTNLKIGEILTSLKIPLPGENRQGSIYSKLTTRKAMDIAFVGVAILLEIDKEDCISKARIALGAVAPTPIRAPLAEKALEGIIPNDEAVQNAAEVAATYANPISDLRASAEYRREMVIRLCQKGLLMAYSQAQSREGVKNA